MNQDTSIELLAPDGSYEALHAAINAGCSAIYFGLQGFNMRANSAKPFTLEDLKEIADICHNANIHCYLALNTLVYDKDLSLMREVIDAVKKNGVDAIITFDVAAIRYAREVDVEVHISTQHSISNLESVKFFAQFADRMVLARELTIDQIKEITQQIKEQNICGPAGKLVEIEIFIHGAMCVSVSGRCGMSLYLFGTSANCGECSQPCRRAYTVTDKWTGKQLEIDNEYVMSPEDLCTIGMLDEILSTGAVSLKIEGRGRAPEYVDKVVRCYREALDAITDKSYSKGKIEEWNKRLGTVFHRGLSEGFYHGKAFAYWSGQANSKATQKKELVGIVTAYYPKIEVAEISVQVNTLDEGEACLFIGKTTGVLRCTAKEFWVNEAPAIHAKQGDEMTMVVPGCVRVGDKLYKLVQVSE
ncbi:collagenase-like protease [Candidatus Uhrbacteria bacterium CG10_big_fil_rev_8_21_14_0_10_48_16]|uniref:Collagenase-like protease n=1 Tax=Candidatus Uhrbacteria bacterium CG10_big_fil_rev_8_21_14_0_10_48_16 TaxID=1975038 RepID=A0A2M8LHE3_9BACT|nr:MAG: collagenase-like protease [Candidatus Uhrbacteria bacterium CG10_big_fil_rev_8_21_14_0_10_48_16]